MKESISRPDAATGTTTAKQERYEKKMAKYRANKARKEQKDKTTATAAEKENLNEIFMMLALNFFADETANNSVCTFKDTETGETDLVGFVVWSSDGRVINVEAFHTGGIDPDIASEWVKFVNSVVSPYAGNRNRDGYIHAPNRGVIRKEWIPLIVKSALVDEKARNVA